MIQLTAGITYLGVICMLAALVVGMCTYIEAFILDLKQQFQRLSDLPIINPSRLRSKDADIEGETMLLLKNTIELHTDMFK